MRTEAYVLRRNCGRPRWTLHELDSNSVGTCGVAPDAARVHRGERPRGDVRYCRRCFPGDDQNEARIRARLKQLRKELVRVKKATHEIIAVTQVCIGDVVPYANRDRKVVGIDRTPEFVVLKFPEDVDWHLYYSDKVKVVS